MGGSFTSSEFTTTSSDTCGQNSSLSYPPKVISSKPGRTLVLEQENVRGSISLKNFLGKFETEYGQYLASDCCQASGGTGRLQILHHRQSISISGSKGNTTPEEPKRNTKIKASTVSNNTDTSHTNIGSSFNISSSKPTSFIGRKYQVIHRVRKIVTIPNNSHKQEIHFQRPSPKSPNITNLPGNKPLSHPTFHHSPSHPTFHHSPSHPTFHHSPSHPTFHQPLSHPTFHQPLSHPIFHHSPSPPSTTPHPVFASLEL
ncbi:hypothetical protein Pmani_027578 [Petrolisthes manimaculis]|uniref:Uncharacterized protein n=1 Tax=Petrolisthes manimaculis TaxID=1843537 RepID=A0AAE1P2P2_9EUCA|nr:hypothetical protein Pmani_027578 [Petrolisthes manimaculis]